MSFHYKNCGQGFGMGYNLITGPKDETGMEFGIITLDRPIQEAGYDREACIALLTGEGQFVLDNKTVYVRRKSVFKENPFVMSIPVGQSFTIIPWSRMEVAIIRTVNEKQFTPKIFTPKDLRIEERGKENYFRRVKTVFDYSNRPESDLVFGEVLVPAGNHSSYPGHGHDQPEIYFYRFSPEEGYGLCCLDDRVLKVGHNDLVTILNGATHPQTAAGGYAEWYIWVIRHLPGNPYVDVKFDPRHEWLK